MLSDRLRLRTYVLNIGFWNPALLAREIATLDVLSGGRAELGLGAGHMKSEHVDAGLPWFGHGRRMEILTDAVRELRTRLTDFRPAPVQQPIPFMVAAMSERGLALAAEQAEIVGFSGLRQVPGEEPGHFTIVSEEETARRVAEVRAAAGGRAYRSDVLVQMIKLGADPRESAEELAAQLTEVTPKEVLASPFLLLARDAEEAADELRRREEVYGFDSVTTHQPSMAALGEVIAAYRR
jgi:probable F420-dependent oxidoreductase